MSRYLVKSKSPLVIRDEKNKVDNEYLSVIGIGANNISLRTQNGSAISLSRQDFSYPDFNSGSSFINYFSSISKASSLDPYYSSPEEVSRAVIGWQDFADSNTSAASPLTQTNILGGEVQLTNNNNDTLTDGNTNINANTSIEGLNDTWDTSTNTFVFNNTGLGKNDRFDIRFNLKINANIISQDFKVRMDFYDAPGGLGNYIFSLSKKGASITESAGVFEEDFIHIQGFIGESILNGSAKAYLVGTKAFEVEVVGFNITYLKISR